MRTSSHFFPRGLPPLSLPEIKLGPMAYNYLLPPSLTGLIWNPGAEGDDYHFDIEFDMLMVDDDPMVAPPSPCDTPLPESEPMDEDDLADPEDDDQPRVRLPATAPQMPLPRFEHLIMTLTHRDLYREDYCLTFYKRNAHGYMFIREPTNLLKINYTGSKPWVQLKVKLPDGDAVISKRLKVNVKSLPVWKPMNLNSHPKRKDKKRWKKS